MRADDQPLSVTEMTELRNILLGHAQKAQGIDSPNDAILDILSTLYRKRLGPAAGSTAFNKPTGHTATRYYDEEFEQLRWIVLTSPLAGDVRAKREDSLTGIGWEVRERPWRELLYRS